VKDRHRSSDRTDNLLAIVEDDQRPAARVDGSADLSERFIGAAVLAQYELEGVTERAAETFEGLDLAQIAKNGAHLTVVRVFGTVQLQVAKGQAGLTHPRGAGDGDEPFAPREAIAETIEIVDPAEELHERPATLGQQCHEPATAKRLDPNKGTCSADMWCSYPGGPCLTVGSFETCRRRQALPCTARPAEAPSVMGRSFSPCVPRHFTNKRQD
jgi:hypothetical protein